MHRYKIKAFGVTRDILGARENIVESEAQTVAELRQELALRYPRLAALKSLMLAVNSAYAEEGARIGESDEIALIPPVSGG